MALTSVGAIYATQSKLLQRIYIPHADDSEINNQHVGTGETLVHIPIATYATGGPPAVQNAIGTPTFSGRCAVVSGGVVVTHIIADPAIYTDPSGNTIVASDISVEGDTWDGTNFKRNYALFNKTTGVVSSIQNANIASAPQPNATTGVIVANALKVGGTVFIRPVAVG